MQNVPVATSGLAGCGHCHVQWARCPLPTPLAAARVQLMFMSVFISLHVEVPPLLVFIGADALGFHACVTDFTSLSLLCNIESPASDAALCTEVLEVLCALACSVSWGSALRNGLWNSTRHQQDTRLLQSASCAASASRSCDGAAERLWRLLRWRRTVRGHCSVPTSSSAVKAVAAVQRSSQCSYARNQSALAAIQVSNMCTATGVTSRASMPRETCVHHHQANWIAHPKFWPAPRAASCGPRSTRRRRSQRHPAGHLDSR